MSFIGITHLGDEGDKSLTEGLPSKNPRTSRRTQSLVIKLASQLANSYELRVRSIGPINFGVYVGVSQLQATISRTTPGVKSSQKNNTIFVSEDLCGQILDKYPDSNSLKKLHAKIVIHQILQGNPSIAIKLIRAYAACGGLDCARHLFDESPNKNVVFCNVMIRSYVNNGRYRDALIIFKRMSTFLISPDHYTYPCVLKASAGCESSCLGMQIHSAVTKIGLDSNLFTANGLVAMYGKCGRLVEARKVLDEMPNRDVVSWNSLVAAYAKNSMFDEALSVCREMIKLGSKPDAGTMASLLPAVSNTTMENVSFVKEMFSSLSRTSLVAWNVMIAVYVNNLMASEAIDLYSKLEEYRFNPDMITVASVLPACGDLCALTTGRKIHSYIEMNKMRPNLTVENALIDMYAKCGCLRDAREVFDTMQRRDIVSWTSMVSAYGASGKGEEAVTLFSKMVDEGVIPDSIAFVAIMSACSHAGLLEEGRDYYRLMSEEYRIAPRIEHYSCMVDLLGRGGKVDEAFEFVKKMNVDPNERIWGSLLGACRVHSEMKLGLIAADRLFKMVPNEAGYYVLLSNIYAKAGRWEEVTAVRSVMKRRGIKKTPGVSNVEIGGEVYTFLAGDVSHPRWKEIYKELGLLVGKMIEVGYVSENESALHDVEEEDKQHHLAVHSEKLAIVFALMNTSAPAPIRITKNLRVCGDCHGAIKLISRITGREITVRDTYRFHHFRDGICSCGDYW
ncbi:uncharacterized protein [Phyllobates terribilis]|uniref:uncharacterized protein n=1 Tax=Phyllobates terribilis TaxID=111132 RepID=UPI003CCB3B7F